MKDILILTASIGSGHIKAAEAIEQELRRLAPQLRIRTVDFMSRDFSFFNWLLKKIYLTMLAWVPDLYDRCYRFAGASTGSGLSRDAFSRVMLPSLKRLLRTERPSLILCTHPFPEGAASLLKRELKRRGRESFTLATVLTDYSVHEIWFYPLVDVYFVATDEMMEELVERTEAGSLVVGAGIPVSGALATLPSKEEMRHALGLKEMPTVLLMGGGLGLGGLCETFLTLEGLKERLQLLIVAGKNTELLLRVQKLARSSHHEVRAFGYLENVCEYMRASDLLLTKPGALTISEALVLGLPMLLHDPIPGPETENAIYATRRGAAVWLHPGEHIGRAVEELLSGDLERMSGAARRTARAHAAEDIAHVLLRVLAKS